MQLGKVHCRSAVWGVVIGGVMLMLTGCGLGPVAAPGTGFDPPPSPNEVMKGAARGGYSPIVGAYAYLFQSQNNGYSGQAALVAHNLPQSDHGTTDANGEQLTGGDGEFSFTVGSPCIPGNLLYVVISGGVSGGTTANNQILEVAPIGICGAGGATTASYTYVNELSTVATAYALGNFITIDSSNVPAVGAATGPYIVNISTPANNNANPVSGATVPSVGNCTNGATYVSTGSNDVSTGSTCTASGLAHAYGDVGKLVTVSQNPMTANAVVPGNANSAVPQALINTEASILQSCVNSNGMTAVNGAFNFDFTGGGTSTLTLTAALPTDYVTGSVTFTLTNGSSVTTYPASAASNTLTEFTANINQALNGSGVSATLSNGVVTVAALAGTLTETSSLIDVGNDGTTCGALMALALPVIDDTQPQNTLQAAINMAKNPYVNSANVQKIFALATSQPAFHPVLTAAPPDWTIAVSYQTPLPQSGGTVQASGFAYTPALDADDNVYVAEDISDPFFGGGPGVIACIDAFTHSGLLISGTGWGCNAVSGASAYVDILPDALGNLWTANANNGTSNAGHLALQFSAANGNLLNSYIAANTAGAGRLWAITDDKNNDYFVTISDQNQGNVQMIQNSGGVWSPLNITGSPSFYGASRSMAVDTLGNVWAASYGANSSSYGGALSVLPSTATTPAYNSNSSPVVAAAVAGGTVPTNTNSNSGPYGVAVDANANAWGSNVGLGTYSGVIGISEGVPSTIYPMPVAPTVSMIFPNTTYTGIVQPKYLEVDGANNLWVADSNGYHEFNLSNSTEISENGGFEPCYLGAAGTATTCSASYDSSSRGIVIDAVGDVWTVYSDQKNASNKSQGRLFQIIGSAFPTWPLKAQQQPGYPAGCNGKLVNGQCASNAVPASISVDLSTYAADCTGHSQSTICLESIDDAITVAGSAIAANGDLTYTINIPAGTWDFSDEGPLTNNGTVVDDQGNPVNDSLGNPINQVFNVNGIAPSGSGSLNILGAGSGSTTLIVSNLIGQIEGIGISHIHFGGYKIQTKYGTTTQGTVTASGQGYMTITVPPNFPTPLAIYNTTDTGGRYLKVYDNTNISSPTLNQSALNNQIAWGYNGTTSTYLPPVQVGPNSWTFYYNNPKLTASSIVTAVNQIVCVKSEIGGQAYYFNNIGHFPGVDVGFNDVIWQDKSRGVWRNFTTAYVTNSAIVRRPPPNGPGTQANCLAAAAGGPQYGQPGDTTYPIGGFIVNNYTAEAVGDDALAIFNDTSTTTSVTNTNIGDDLARDINLFNSCHIQLSNNVGHGCQVNYPGDVPAGYAGCITDTSQTCTNFPL